MGKLFRNIYPSSLIFCGKKYRVPPTGAFNPYTNAPTDRVEIEEADLKHPEVLALTEGKQPKLVPFEEEPGEVAQAQEVAEVVAETVEVAEVVEAPEVVAEVVEEVAEVAEVAEVVEEAAPEPVQEETVEEEPPPPDLMKNIGD